VCNFLYSGEDCASSFTAFTHDAARSSHSVFDGCFRIGITHNLLCEEFDSAIKSAAWVPKRPTLVWVDGDHSYDVPLSGSTRKKFGLISETGGTLSDTVAVPSGLHQIRVRVTAEDGSSSHEETTTGEFPANGQLGLAINARRSDLSIQWLDAEPITSIASAHSPSGWMSRYAGMMLMTVAGSIVSALTGYAIKEFPKHMASRGTGSDTQA